MRHIINLREALKIECGINLGRGNRCVSQHFLYRAQIAGRLQQVRGERMTQHVRMHVRGNAGILRMRLQPQLDHACRDAGAALGQK